MRLSPDEVAAILAERERHAQDERDRAALEAVLPRAKTVGERRALEQAIALRGGAASPETGTLYECLVCYARGYGK